LLVRRLPFGGLGSLAPVQEAATLLLLGSSFATLGVALRRRLAARKAEAGYRG
jgi:hypothetical protein